MTKPKWGYVEVSLTRPCQASLRFGEKVPDGRAPGPRRVTRMPEAMKKRGRTKENKREGRRERGIGL